MEAQTAPQRRSNLRPFFTLTIAPGGNIQRTIGEIKSRSSRQGLGYNAAWLPDGIYLGFYQGKDDFDRSIVEFPNLCIKMFAAMPVLFEFSCAEIHDGLGYIVPKEPIDTIILAADEAAASLSLSRTNMVPFRPGLGFFIGKDVTLPLFKAFSFRHLDLTLMRIDTEGTEWLSATWTILAKAPRRVGPRPRILEE